MPQHGLRIVALLGLAVVLGSATSFCLAAEQPEQTQRLKEKKPKPVSNVGDKANKIDNPDENLEPSTPEGFDPIGGGKFKIISKTFLPPLGKQFTTFPDGTWVDIERDPEGLTIDKNVENKNTVERIKVSATEAEAGTAGQFPMKCEGNLKGGGGAGAGTPPHWSAKVEKIVVSLELRTTDQISEADENDKHDSAVAASGTHDLGELPMGTGRTDPPFKDNCYICASEMVGTVIVPANPAGLQFRWKRCYSDRSWYVAKNGDQWNVTNRTVNGILAPKDDTSPDFDDATPSATKKMYSYDNSGTRLDTAPSAVGDYIMQEKKFTYTVEVLRDGTWVTAGMLDVYQTITVKRVDNTGTVANDWQGVNNSYSTTATDLKISKPKVADVTGAAEADINIDANANKDQ